MTNKIEKTLISVGDHSRRTETSIRPQSRASDNIIIVSEKLKIRETCKVETKSATGFILGAGANTLGTTLLGDTTYSTVEEFNGEFELTDTGKEKVATLLEGTTIDEPQSMEVGDSSASYNPSQTDIQGTTLDTQTTTYSDSGNVLNIIGEFNAASSANGSTIKEYGVFGTSGLYIRRPISDFAKSANNFLRITSTWTLSNG